MKSLLIYKIPSVHSNSSAFLLPSSSSFATWLGAVNESALLALACPEGREMWLEGNRVGVLLWRRDCLLR